jgi:hypothetical protein
MPLELQKRYELTGWYPPYTTVEPDIVRYKLRPQDKFLVLATDGLFQVRLPRPSLPARAAAAESLPLCLRRT